MLSFLFRYRVHHCGQLEREISHCGQRALRGNDQRIVNMKVLKPHAMALP